MKFNLRLPSLKSLWAIQSVRIGALVAFAGGAIGTIANLNSLIGMFTPDETTEIVASADAKIDEILTLMRVQAAIVGTEIEPRSEDMIKSALQAILTTADARKKAARAALEAGEVERAAEEIARVARAQAEAAGATGAAAAESWKEAGALYAPNDPAASLAAYEEARRLDPDDFEVWNAVGSTHALLGDFDAAEHAFAHVRDNAGADTAEHAWALQGLGAIAFKRGDVETAQSLFLEAYECSVRIGAERVAAVAANNLGVHARRRGALDDAEKHLNAALAHARKAQEPAYEARALGHLGVVEFQRGNTDTGAELVRKANDIYEARGELRHQATTIGNLGAMALALGDTETAAGYIEQSVALGERLGLKESLAQDHANLAELARQQGDLGKARAHIVKAREIADEIGFGGLKPNIAATAAQIEEDGGDQETACRLYEESIAGFAAQGDATGAAVAELSQKAGCEAS